MAQAFVDCRRYCYCKSTTTTGCEWKPAEKGRTELLKLTDDCLKSSLRMRPDRIIVGEVRSSEAATLLTAMNTGHDGSFGSLHANTAMETITRMINPPMNVPPIMLTGFDLIIIQANCMLMEKPLEKLLRSPKLLEWKVTNHV